MSFSNSDIIARVRAGGVIGAGGAGFPTDVKLGAKVDTVIANGSECEPLLYTDKCFMKEKGELLVYGMQLAMKLTGAKEGIIALKGKYGDVVRALEKVLPEDGSIRLHLLNNYYPAGDEFLLVYDVLGKVIPEGGLPLDVGAVVSNVISLGQIGDAANGKPVTSRMITITGEVSKPQVLSVPIGTSYIDLIEMAGGATVKDFTVVDGGPMMGEIVKDINSGVAKTTSGVIVLPNDHFIVRTKNKTVLEMARKSKAACCQCFRCTDLCPRSLLGHDIYPHMTMRTIDYESFNETKHVTSAFLCSQCGVCEMVACDSMELSPKKIYATYRQKLSGSGVKNPHGRKELTSSEEIDDRKIPINMLMKKIGVDQYSRELLYKGEQTVNSVRIPIGRHIGAPAKMKVALGDTVKIGDVIAACDDKSLGTVYHATIAGKVTDVDLSYVEIRN